MSDQTQKMEEQDSSRITAAILHSHRDKPQSDLKSPINAYKQWSACALML